MICPNCGSYTDENSKFCFACGYKLVDSEANSAISKEHTAPQFQQAVTMPSPEQYQQTAPYQQPHQYQQAAPQFQQPPIIPPEYRPLGAWAYFGYQLLFAIPVVGFILLIVFSTGAARNLNLRSFARSHFCFLAVAAIAFVIILIIALAAGVGLSSMFK